MSDHPKAALKNLADATVLLDKERWDGAAYHAGFVVECTLNALLDRVRVPPPTRHGIAALEQQVNALAASKKCRSINATQSDMLRYAGLYRWNPILIRYSAEFVHDKPTAESWVRGARQFYYSVKP